MEDNVYSLEEIAAYLDAKEYGILKYVNLEQVFQIIDQGEHDEEILDIYYELQDELAVEHYQAINERG